MGESERGVREKEKVRVMCTLLLCGRQTLLLLSSVARRERRTNDSLGGPDNRHHASLLDPSLSTHPSRLSRSEVPPIVCWEPQVGALLCCAPCFMAPQLRYMTVFQEHPFGFQFSMHSFGECRIWASGGLGASWEEDGIALAGAEGEVEVEQAT